MAIELPNTSSSSLSHPEITGQLPKVEMTPYKFNRLTNSYITSVELIKVPQHNIDQGYKGDLLRVEDKLIIGEGGDLQPVPQFIIQLGTHLSSEERGQALVKEVIGMKIQDQIRKKRPPLTTHSEVFERARKTEEEMRRFYESNKGMVDFYVESMVSKGREPIPQQELLV